MDPRVNPGEAKVLEISLTLHRLGHRAADRGAAAIDDVLRAGDVAGEVGAQEQHDVGDLLGRRVAPGRDRRLVSLADASGSSGLIIFSSEWIIRVSTGPGQTALTRTPWRATSPAAVLVRPITACFEAT